MKAKIIPILTLLSLFSFFFSSCEDSTYKEYTGYSPVYLSYKDLRSAVKQVGSSDLKNPGKIYFKDNYIFIVEELEGIHVYDNTNPATPVNKAFVKIPGVVDISVSGSTLYADSYVDLVVLDVQDVENIHETGRVPDVLPYTVPQSKTDFPSAYVDKDKGVVISWELKTIKEVVNNNPNPYPIYYLSGISFLVSKIRIGLRHFVIAIYSNILHRQNWLAIAAADIPNGHQLNTCEGWPNWIQLLSRQFYRK
jgi:hypothetical protein